jgi:hypothetical protein
MTISEPTTTAIPKGFCNVLARQKGLDPAGHASDFTDQVIIETSLPWKNSMYDVAGKLPQELLDLYGVWMKDYEAGRGYPHSALLIAPDPAYSRPGFRRVMFYTRPYRPRPHTLSRGERGEADVAGSNSTSSGGTNASSPFMAYDKVEYLVPDAEVGPLLWALYQQRDALPRFEPWRDPAGDTLRDLLVCTHGTVDAACAKFGIPLYNLLKKHHTDAATRVWRVSHFGGHVFAPTLIDMPTGHYWAYVEPPQAAQIARRDGDVSALRGHYRGWAGLPSGFVQAAERELWQHYGWAWLDFPRAGAIRAKDEATEEPQWADIEITFTLPDGREGCYRARVRLGPPVPTIDTTGSSHIYPWEQYLVTEPQLVEDRPTD